MLVAIERNKFTYLYKYNQIRIDINQVIDQQVENLKRMLHSDFNELLQLFNKAIPLFEQDHEIILLEVDKSKIKFRDGIMLSFDSILCIYPITIIGGKLLDGKISDDFIVEHPVFENAIESLKLIRSMEFRRATSEKLLAHFNLATILNKQMISAIEAAVKKNLLDKNQPQVFTTFLDHLIAYNKTPSYIPDGSIEHICKIGAIAIKFLGKTEEVFTNGPFYKSSLKYKSIINNKSYSDSYLAFISISDVELKISYEKMVDLISKDYMDVDIFKISYFFLAFKSFINKNDNNIDGISNEIVTLNNQDRITAAFVLSLLGYTFSIENIYEGIHSLSNAPLLKSTIRKKAAELEKANRESAIKVHDPSIEKETVKEVIGKFEEPIIVKPIDTVSEPIVIYDSNDPLPQKENDEMENADTNTNQEDRITNGEDIVKKLPHIEMLTVQNFRNYILNEQTKAKQKIWSQFLDYYFPTKNDDITYESIVKKLDENQEVKEKLFKTKKDKESIKAFFDAYK